MSEVDDEAGDLNAAQDDELHQLRANFESSVNIEQIVALAVSGEHGSILEIHADMMKLISFYGDGWIDTALKGVIVATASSSRRTVQAEAEREEERSARVQAEAEREEERSARVQAEAEREEERSARVRAEEGEQRAVARYTDANLLSLWSGWLQHDPKTRFTSNSTQTTQIPLLYRPDAVQRWEFASCKDLTYSLKECQDFFLLLENKVVDRVDVSDLASYSKRQREGHAEPPVQEAFKSLVDAVAEALNRSVCDSDSQVSSKNLNTVDELTGTHRTPDLSILQGDVTICVVELKTESTFRPSTLEDFAAPRNVNHATFTRYDPRRRQNTSVPYKAAGDPIAQICCHMVNSGCRYGIISNWAFTYFLKLELQSNGTMILHHSDGFSPFTKEGAEQGLECAVGNERLGDVARVPIPGCGPASLAHATVLFIWLAMRDLVDPPDEAGPEYIRAAMETRRCSKGFPKDLNARVHSIEAGTDGENGLGTGAASSANSNQGEEAIENVLSFKISNDSVVPVLFKHGVGYSETTVTNLETGHEISGCFAKSIMVDDMEMAHLESYQSALYHFENEVDMYQGPARALQGTVIPTVVYVGEYDNGAGMNAVLVTQNAGHALNSTEGKRIVKAQGLMKVKERVHAAIDALHNAGITHGDMGLRNVTIREDGGVSLIDLGSASCDTSGAYRDFEHFDNDFNATFSQRQR